MIARKAAGKTTGKTAGLLAALLLAGCGGGNTEAPLEMQLWNTGRDIFARNQAAKAEPPSPTRAELDTLEDPYLEVTVENRDIFAYLYISAERRDDTPGRILVWRTFDDISIATRNGVVIATRGLGNDILSSTVQVSGTRPGPSASGAHIQMIRALDNKEILMAYGCDLQDLGPETIEIIGLRHATRHLRQSCSGETGSFVNDFWVDSRAGLVWQSRQWAGPATGYIRLRRLTN